MYVLVIFPLDYKLLGGKSHLVFIVVHPVVPRKNHEMHIYNKSLAVSNGIEQNSTNVCRNVQTHAIGNNKTANSYPASLQHWLGSEKSTIYN